MREVTLFVGNDSNFQRQRGSVTRSVVTILVRVVLKWDFLVEGVADLSAEISDVACRQYKHEVVTTKVGNEAVRRTPTPDSIAENPREHKNDPSAPLTAVSFTILPKMVDIDVTDGYTMTENDTAGALSVETR